MTANEWVKQRCRFAQVANQVSMSPKERAIFDFLLEVQAAKGLPGQLRVAGGWVRDKLLSKASDDIDIALDAMTGAQFEQAIGDYSREYEAKTGQPHPAVGKTYVVKANPEKSKHLETVAVSIYDQKIDLVNTRSEQYGDSRIPEMRMGTPEEDAFRRDLTINALFYNLNTQEVEDFTGMGVRDLETMTLRTPLDPTKTFMDDPLRMLRVLRFFAKYPNSSIVPETLAALANPEIHKAYVEKIAPSRAGIELVGKPEAPGGILGAAEPEKALRVMFQTGLDKAVFSGPEIEGLNELTMDQRNKHHAHNLLEHTLLVIKNMNDLARQEGLDTATRIKLNMAALFHDYGKAHPEIGKPKPDNPAEYGYSGHEDKSVEIADGIMRRLGIGEQERAFVNKVVEMHMRPHAESWNNRTIGRFLRDSRIEGQDSEALWRYIHLHGIADEMAKGTGDEAQGVALKRQHMQQFEQFLNQPPPVKPLLNGQELIGLFPTIKPKTGFIREVNERMLAEQDAGTLATPEQARTWVESIRPEIEAKYGPKKAKSWLRRFLRF